MSLLSVIPISEVISSAKAQLGLEDTNQWDNFFQLFGREAARNLRCLGIYTKHQCKLDIVDSKSKLPCNFYRLVALRFPKNNNQLENDSTTGFFNFIYVDKPFLKDCKTGDPAFLANFSQTFQINGNYIYYNTDISTITSRSEIAYIGLNTDEQGNLIIYEDYERAIRAYMCYHFALRFKDKFTTFQTLEFKKDWIFQKAEMKGQYAVNQFYNDKDEVAAVATGLLVSFTSTWGT